MAWEKTPYEQTSEKPTLLLKTRLNTSLHEISKQNYRVVFVAYFDVETIKMSTRTIDLF